MNFFELLLFLLVYIGGTDLFTGDTLNGKRFLWPLLALLIGIRKMVTAVREMFASHQVNGNRP